MSIKTTKPVYLNGLRHSQWSNKAIASPSKTAASPLKTVAANSNAIVAQVVACNWIDSSDFPAKMPHKVTLLADTGDIYKIQSNHVNRQTFVDTFEPLLRKTVFITGFKLMLAQEAQFNKTDNMHMGRRDCATIIFEEDYGSLKVYEKDQLPNIKYTTPSGATSMNSEGFMAVPKYKYNPTALVCVRSVFEGCNSPLVDHVPNLKDQQAVKLFLKKYQSPFGILVQPLTTFDEDVVSTGKSIYKATVADANGTQLEITSLSTPTHLMAALEAGIQDANPVMIVSVKLGYFNGVWSLTADKETVGFAINKEDDEHEDVQRLRSIMANGHTPEEASINGKIALLAWRVRQNACVACGSETVKMDTGDDQCNKCAFEGAAQSGEYATIRIIAKDTDIVLWEGEASSPEVVAALKTAFTATTLVNGTFNVEGHQLVDVDIPADNTQNHNDDDAPKETPVTTITSIEADANNPTNNTRVIDDEAQTGTPETTPTQSTEDNSDQGDDLEDDVDKVETPLKKRKVIYDESEDEK